MFKNLHYKKIGSTNDKAKQLAKRGEENIVIVADGQKNGRGRFGRKWVSGKGGLYFSILLKDKNVNKAKYLTFISAISIVKAIKKVAGLNTYIKWPNDVYFNNKKLCGILTETILGNENYIIVGVGLNINQNRFPKHLSTATSLKKELGNNKDTNKKLILNNFLNYFNFFYWQYRNKRYKKILDEWKKYDRTIGSKIKAVTQNGTFTGKAVGVDKNCNLILKLENNKTIKIIEGDVILTDKNNYTIVVRS